MEEQNLNKRGATKVPRPHTWKSGPDEYKHSMYIPFLKSKAQAKFRKEEWELTFDEFYDLWKDLWTLRGRSTTSYSMTRKDKSKSWKIGNVIVITRNEQISKSKSEQVRPKKYKKRTVKLQKIDPWLQ